MKTQLNGKCKGENQNKTKPNLKSTENKNRFLIPLDRFFSFANSNQLLVYESIGKLIFFSVFNFDLAISLHFHVSSLFCLIKQIGSKGMNRKKGV